MRTSAIVIAAAILSFCAPASASVLADRGTSSAEMLLTGQHQADEISSRHRRWHRYHRVYPRYHRVRVCKTYWRHHRRVRVCRWR
jgi:hypothetical protein